MPVDDTRRISLLLQGRPDDEFLPAYIPRTRPETFDFSLDDETLPEPDPVEEDDARIFDELNKPSSVYRDPLKLRIDEFKRANQEGRAPDLDMFEPSFPTAEELGGLNPVGGTEFGAWNQDPDFDDRAKKAARLRIERQGDQDSITPEKISTQALLGVRKGAEADLPRMIAGVGMPLGKAIDYFGGDEVGPAMTKASREAAHGAAMVGREYDELGKGVGGEVAGEVTRLISSSAVSLLPTIPAFILGGLPAAGVVAGTQSFGSTYADAADQFAFNLDRETAEDQALAPALLSGLATMLTTRAFGASGIEAAFAQRTAAPATFTALMGRVLQQAGAEATEEGIDQIWQSAIAKATYNPEMTFQQALESVLIAGAAGGVLGGAVNVATGIPLAAETVANAPRRIAQSMEDAEISRMLAGDPELQAARENEMVMAPKGQQSLEDYFVELNGEPNPTRGPAPGPAPGPANTSVGAAEYQPEVETLAPVPKPEWRVAVQATQGDVPGYVQIIDPTGSEQDQSPTVETLRAAGVAVPDFSKLPTGSYTWAEASALLAPKETSAVPPVVPPAQTPPVTTPLFEMNPKQRNIVDLMQAGRVVTETTSAVGKKAGEERIVAPDYIRIQNPEYSPELGEQLTSDASDKKSAKRTITRRITFFEDQETAQVIGLPTYSTHTRGKEYRVAALPGQKKGTTLQKFMASGRFVPIASVRVEPVNATDANDVFIYADAKDFEARVDIPASEDIAAALRTRAAVEEKMQAQSISAEGAVTEKATAAQLNNPGERTGIDASEEMTNRDDTTDGGEAAAVAEVTLDDLMMDALPRDNKGKIQKGLSEEDVKEAVLFALESDDGGTIKKAVYLAALTDLQAQPEFQAMTTLEQQQAIINQVYLDVYEKYSKGDYHAGDLAGEKNEPGAVASRRVPVAKSLSRAFDADKLTAKRPEKTSLKTALATPSTKAGTVEDWVDILGGAGSTVDLRVALRKLTVLLRGSAIEAELEHGVNSYKARYSRIASMMAEALSKTDSGTPVEFFSGFGINEGVNASGTYDYDNKISIFLGAMGSETEAIYTILHEAVHAKISYMVVAFNRDPFNIRETLPQGQWQAIHELETLFEAAKKHFNGKPQSEYYGLTELNEFVTEMVSNPSFQRDMQAVKAPAGFPKAKSLYDAFIDVLRRLFQLPLKAGDDSVFHQAMVRILELSDQHDPALRAMLVAGTSAKSNRPSDAAREQAQKSVSQTGVVIKLREELLADMEAGGMAGKVARATIWDPKLRAVMKDAELLAEQIEKFQTDAANWFVLKSDARFQADPDWRGNIAGGIISSIDLLRAGTTQMEGEFEDRQKTDMALAKTLAEKKEKSRGLASVSSTVLAEYRDLLTAGMAGATDRAVLATLKRQLQQGDAARNIFAFIIGNQVNMAELTKATTPAEFQALLMVASGKTDLPDFLMQVGASEEMIQAVGGLLIESEALQNALKLGQDLLDKPPSKAEAKFYDELRNRILESDIAGAIKLFTDGAAKAGAKRGQHLNKGNFFAREERRVVVRMAAREKVRRALKLITSDPQFLALEQEVFAELGVVERTLGANNIVNALKLMPIPGYHDGFSFDLDSTEAAGKSNLSRMEEYAGAAQAYLAQTDSPLYNEATANGLRAWLARQQSFRNLSLLPSSGMEVQGEAVNLAQKLTSFGDGWSIFGDVVAARVAGLSGQYLSETLNAYTTAHKLATAVLTHREAELVAKTKAALKAHDNMSVQEYRWKIWNPLLESRQYYENARVIGVGDVVNGETIRQSDIALMNAVRSFENDVLKKTFGAEGGLASMVANRSGIAETVYGQQRLRNRMATGPDTIERHTHKALSWWNRYSKLDLAGRIAMLDANAPELLVGYAKGASEKSFKFGYRHRELLKHIYELHLAGETITSVDQLAEKMVELHEPAEESDELTTADFTASIVSEIKILLERIGKEDTGKLASTTTQSKIRGGQSGLNTARGEQSLPGLWYDYGSLTTGQHIGFVIKSLTQFATAHDQAVKLAVQELSQKIDDFKRNPNPSSNDSYTSSRAEMALTSLRQYQAWLNALGKNQANDVSLESDTFEGWFHAGRSVVVGSLLSSIGVNINNMVTGGLAHGAMFQMAMNDRNFLGAFGSSALLTAKSVLKEISRMSATGADIALRKVLFRNSPKLMAKAEEMLEPLFNYVQDIKRHREEMAEVGLNPLPVFNEAMGAIWDAMGTGGHIKEGKGGVGQRVVAGMTGFGAFLNQMFVGRGDAIINSHMAPQLANEFEDKLRLRIKRFGTTRVETARRLGYDPFNPLDPRNRFGDKELAGGGMFSNVSAPLDAIHKRDFLRKKIGVDFETLAYDYLKRVEEAGEAGADVPLFTPEQRNQLYFAVAEDINMATFATRPPAFRTGKTANTIGLFMGYGTWAMFKFSRLIGLGLPTGGNRRSNASFLQGKAESLPMALSTALLMLTAGALSFGATDFLRRWILNKSSSMPTLRDLAAGDLTPKETAKMLALSYSSLVPLWGSAYSFVDGRALRSGFDANRQFLILNYIDSTSKYIREMWQSKSVVVPSLRYAQNWIFPLNYVARLFPQYAGLVEISKMRADLSRGARGLGMETELKKPYTGDITYTPQTPLLNEFMNAVGKGDLEGAAVAIQKLVEMEIAAGKSPEEAEKSVARKLQSRNPLTQVFGNKPTDEEMEAVLGNIPPSDAANVKRILDTFETAVSGFTGRPIEFTKTETGSPKISTPSPSSSRRPSSRLSIGSGSRTNYLPRQLNTPSRSRRRSSSGGSSRLSYGSKRRTSRNPRLTYSTKRRKRKSSSRLSLYT